MIPSIYNKILVIVMKNPNFITERERERERERVREMRKRESPQIQVHSSLIKLFHNALYTV